MQHLGEHQHRRLTGQVAQQQPAQRRQHEAGQQHLLHRKAREDAAHGHEHQYFGHHPQCPQQANGPPGIAQVFQVQGEEGVVRPVAELHQCHAGVERDHPGRPQLLQEAARAAALALLHRLGIGYPQAGGDDAGHDRDQRHRVDIQAQPLEQPAQADHGEDEADRAPQAHLAVARGLPVQVGQGDDLELRQHRMPEERVQGHYQRQPGVAFAKEDKGEGGQGRQCAQAHDQQALAGAVTQPAPQVGGDAAHEHGDGHQLADACRREAQVVEVQRQERGGGTEQGEVEQIEAGQAPVGDWLHGVAYGVAGTGPIAGKPAPTGTPQFSGLW
ncbi:hypothetical protein D3C81_727090 [compost metagenome]